MKQAVKEIWHKAASPPHMGGSVVFAKWCQSALRIYKAKKWLPWQRPLGAAYQQCLHSVGQPSNPLHKQLPSRYRSHKAS